MTYIVFARKYRPQAFDEVIGQSHITTTLKNAIAQNRVAHAYIFAGPRGVGKTTTARILAKALNCEKGPTDNPCNVCASCTEITRGVSLDILEIDGASNRGIDEIRNLRENVKFAPSKGRFKVYIIDEVHMLTQEAFNALLKTLEEPPAHVKFIFATTQAHKVPPTILSRCQRFDFRRISIKDIVDSLKKIAAKEGLKMDDEVLILIAKHSDGSMRDAQVVLDQISSNTSGNIKVEDASRILGAVSDDILFDLAGSIKSRDSLAALKIIDNLADEGKDIVQVVLSLIEHFRNLSVVKVSNGPSSLVDASPEKINRYEEQARNFTVEEILYIIYTLSATLDFARKADMARVPFEVAMVKLTRKGLVLTPDDAIKKLIKVEEALVSQPSQQKQQKQAEAQPVRSAQLEEIVSLWPAILNHIKDRKISVAMYLKEGYPSSLEGNTLSIIFPESSRFHKEMLESQDCKAVILKAIKDSAGMDVRIKFDITSASTGTQESRVKDVFENSLGDNAVSKDKTADARDEDPIINDALEIFGGEELGKNKRRENS